MIRWHVLEYRTNIRVYSIRIKVLEISARIYEWTNGIGKCLDGNIILCTIKYLWKPKSLMTLCPRYASSSSSHVEGRFSAIIILVWHCSTFTIYVDSLSAQLSFRIRLKKPVQPNDRDCIDRYELISYVSDYSNRVWNFNLRTSFGVFFALVVRQPQPTRILNYRARHLRRWNITFLP